MRIGRGKEQPLWQALGGTTCVAVLGPLWLEFFVFMLTGVGGFRRGRLWAPAIAAAALGTAARFTWERPAGRKSAVAVLAAFGVVYGSGVPDRSIVSFGVLRDEMDALFPVDYDLVGDSEGGMWLCFDTCPGLSRTWIAPGNIETARAAFDDLLRQKGVTLGPWAPARFGGGVEAEGHRRRVEVAVHVTDRPFTLPTGERVAIAAGQVAVTASLETYSSAGEEQAL